MKSYPRIVSSPISALLLTVLLSTLVLEHAALAQGQQDPGKDSGSGSVTTRHKGTPPPGTSPVAPVAAPYVFPSSGEMNRYWLENTIGLKAVLGSVGTASWNQWVVDIPKEWAKDATGWGQRFGSALLENGINTSTLVLLSRTMGQDPRYRRCDCTGMWPRTRHAIELSFMAYNRSGNLTFSPAKIVQGFAGPLVTRNTIYPDRYDSGDAASGAAYYLVGSVGWNLVREFIRKKF